MRSIFGSLALVGVLAIAPGAHGQDDDEGAAPPAEGEAPVDKRPGQTIVMQGDGDADGVHAEGEYGGVVPGKASEKTVKKSKKGSLVTWVGFQAQGGGAARVFVQLSKEVAYTQNVVGDTLVIQLKGVKLGTRTHGRFIDTSFFDTRVARIEAKNLRGGRGVEVRVKFKKGGAAQADARVEKAADGATYLYLDFAP